MSSEVKIDGFVAPGFEAVREAFALDPRSGSALTILRGTEPVARHWPRFKTETSVREILAHTAGLPVFPVARPATAWADWDLLCADLAEASPQWPPGTVAGEPARHPRSGGSVA